MALDLDHHLRQLADLLYAHNAILCTHPNDLDLSVLPSPWVVPSPDLLEYYKTGLAPEGHSTSRSEGFGGLAPLHIPEACLMSMKGAKGMSPKKAHEVQRMASYIQALAEANDEFGPGTSTYSGCWRWAGILDASLLLMPTKGETVGAENEAGKAKTTAEATNPRITHKTALIKPASLLKAIDEWVSGTGSDQPVPILFSEERRSKGWYPCAAVIVGCCYNLMYPGAQIPGTWLVADKKQPTTWKMQPSMELSTRKIVWRAMLGYSIKACNAQPSGDTPVSPPQPGAGKSAEIPVKWWLETGKQENGAFNRLPSVDRSDASQAGRRRWTNYNLYPVGKAARRWPTLRDGLHFIQVAGRKLGIDWGGGNDEDQKAFLSYFGMNHWRGELRPCTFCDAFRACDRECNPAG
ncbi:hypothetical protein BKA70DRAFT_1400023, partial [Coprinopsis sp. MPI-PUGE-AT-0042]